jgi:hypothetical protein
MPRATPIGPPMTRGGPTLNPQRTHGADSGVAMVLRHSACLGHGRVPGIPEARCALPPVGAAGSSPAPYFPYFSAAPSAKYGAHRPGAAAPSWGAQRQPARAGHHAIGSARTPDRSRSTPANILGGVHDSADRMALPLATRVVGRRRRTAARTTSTTIVHDDGTGGGGQFGLFRGMRFLLGTPTREGSERLERFAVGCRESV